VIAAPEEDADVAGFVEALGLPGLVDVHTHFLPERVMDKVWGYFDAAETHYGTAWPVHYRTSVAERLATLDKLGVQTFAPLVYPHKPGMGRWLTDWVTEFAARTPEPSRRPRSSPIRTWPSTSVRRSRRARGS
jgi:hypothetical protein